PLPAPAGPAPISGPIELPVALAPTASGERGRPQPSPVVPGPAGPPPISGPVPVRPRLYAVR
ncbi:MAG: hypothetical protein ACXV0U_07660, partial [Kineosporiaceae bacterium]